MYSPRDLVSIVKDNSRYLMSDAVGFGLSWGAATGSMYGLSHTDWSDGAKVLGVFTIKSLAFAAGKIGSHGSHARQLAKSSAQNAVVKGSLQILCHYATIKTGLVPEWATPIVGYAIPGLVGTVTRYVQDIRSNIITLDEHKDTP